MKLLLLMLALGISACDREEKSSTAAQPLPAPGTALTAEAKISRPPAVVPKPDDPAEVDRMILAGFTPHADHLHPPGVESCPLAKGSDVVM